MRRLIPVMLSVAALAGCADPNIRPVRYALGASENVVMGANLRTVSERDRPLPDGTNRSVVCTEPSPDAVIAFGRKLGGKANYSQPSGQSAGGEFNFESSETTEELEGRTASVLALRDGLYAACQAYANGVLGQDAYALVLSQYGNLLVALGREKPFEGSLFTPQDAAVSALLVSCISQHDPTRLSAGYRNPLLSERRCSDLLDNVARGRLLKSA